MDSTAVIQSLLTQVRHSFLDVMEGVDQQVADRVPPGEAHPIRMTNLHLLWAEDRFVNVFINETEPVWKKIGLEATTGFKAGPIPNAAWARETPIDISDLKNIYMPKVFESTDEYTSNMTNEKLERPVKSDIAGLNGLKVSEILIRLAIHNSNHVGEIAAQKGAQGIKGYSF